MKFRIKIDERKLYIRLFLSFFFIMSVIVLSKAKIRPIFGTTHNISLVGPFIIVIPMFTGITIGGFTIFVARLIQFVLGISKPTDLLSYLAFIPAYLGGIQFRKSMKSDRRIILIPVSAMILFIVHPIGRQVWYYSLFWIIPIIITYFQPYLKNISHKYDIPIKYLYALSAVFVDHAIGSIIYLYYLEIPAVYWNMAIPYVPLERMVMALIVLAFYMFISKSLEALSSVIPIQFREIDVIEVKRVEDLEDEYIIKWEN